MAAASLGLTQALNSAQMVVDSGIAFFTQGIKRPGVTRPPTIEEVAEAVTAVEGMLNGFSDEYAMNEVATIMQHAFFGSVARLLSSTLLYVPSQSDAAGTPTAGQQAGSLQGSFHTLRTASIVFFRTAFASCTRLSIAAAEAAQLTGTGGGGYGAASGYAQSAAGGVGLPSLPPEHFTLQLSASRAKEVAICPAIMTLLSSAATFEAVRLAACEAIFALVMSNPYGVVVARDAKVDSQLVRCAVLDPSNQVRSLMLSVIREMAATIGDGGSDRQGGVPIDHATVSSAIEQAPFLLKMYQTDESVDVRVLCAETLLRLLEDGILMRVDGGPRVICDAVLNRLKAEPATEVRLATYKLMHLLIVVAAEEDHIFVYEMLGTAEVCQILVVEMTLEPTVAAAAARILRRLLHTAPPAFHLSRALVAPQNGCLMTLLKLVLTLSSGGATSATISHQILAVELGVILSTVLSASLANRQVVQRELKSVPLWRSAVRSGLLSFLNSAALDYFADMDVVDVTGLRLNAPTSVEWGPGDKPSRISIKQLFDLQEHREHEKASTTPPPLLIEDPATALRAQKLTFVVLSFAVHLALQDESQHAHMSPQSQEQAAMAAAMRVRQSDPNALLPGGGGSGSSPSRRQGGGGAPRFPSASSANLKQLDMHGGTIKSTSDVPITTAEKEQAAIAYDRFDSAFKLVLQFAEYYGYRQKRAAGGAVDPQQQHQQQQSEYQATPDGFVVRSKQLANPWAPVVKKEPLKSWTVQDLRDTDLFYFAIPFDQLSDFACRSVLDRASRHVAALKRALVTAPIHMRGRRWLLSDLINHVMPKVIGLLSKLAELIATHGEANVRFPLFLLREKELHRGERAIHSGNLTEVVDQECYYFSQNPAELFGADNETIAKLEDRMRKIKQQKAAAGETWSPAPSDSDEDGQGHGALSSESD